MKTWTDSADNDRDYWHVSVFFTTALEPYARNNDVFDEVLTALEAEPDLLGPALHGPYDALRRWCVVTGVRRSTAAEAVAVGLDRVPRALVAGGVDDAQVREAEVNDVEGFDSMLAEPVVPELVDLRGIANRYGFSRQRAHQLSKQPGRLPEPVGPGPVFVLSDVEHFMHTRKPKPGPRPWSPRWPGDGHWRYS